MTNSEEGDSKGAAVLLTCLITCSKEQQAIHNLMQPILEMVIKRFNTSKKKSLQHKLYDTIMAAIYYNPQLFLSIFSTDVNTLQSVLVQLFTHLKDITDVFSKRLIVLSMTSLIELSADNSNSIPSIITSNTPAMYKQIITQIDAINKEDGDDNEFVDADEMNDDEEDGSDNDDEDPMAKRGN